MRPWGIPNSQEVINSGHRQIESAESPGIEGKTWKRRPSWLMSGRTKSNGSKISGSLHLCIWDASRLWSIWRLSLHVGKMPQTPLGLSTAAFDCGNSRCNPQGSLLNPNDPPEQSDMTKSEHTSVAFGNHQSLAMSTHLAPCIDLHIDFCFALTGDLAIITLCHESLEGSRAKKGTTESLQFPSATNTSGQFCLFNHSSCENHSTCACHSLLNHPGSPRWSHQTFSPFGKGDPTSGDARALVFTTVQLQQSRRTKRRKGDC